MPSQSLVRSLARVVHGECSSFHVASLVKMTLILQLGGRRSLNAITLPKSLSRCGVAPYQAV